MRRLGLVLILMSGIVALTSSPAYAAEVETQAQVNAVAAVSAESNALGVAANEAQAITDQQKLLPLVKSAVAAGAAHKLLESRDPSVAVDVVKVTGLKHTTKHGSTKRPKLALERNGTEGKEIAPIKCVTKACKTELPPREEPPAQAAHVRARAAYWEGCWSGAWDARYHWEAGQVVAWLYVNANEWCGNGYNQTYYQAPTFAAWAWGPFTFCGGFGENWSWDVWPTWIHSAIWSEFGVAYPWGCWGLEGGKAQVRTAANGYSDAYNDYGF